MATDTRSRRKTTAAGKPGPRTTAAAPVITTDKPVTDASTWRSGRTEGFPIELPSGNVARVRRTLNLLKLLEKGKIPNPLADEIRKMVKTQAPSMELKDAPGESAMQLVDLVNSQIPHIFVEPRVEREPEDWDDDEQGFWEPSDGAITVDDIDMDDKMYAFAFAQGRAVDVQSFREAKEAFMANLVNVVQVEGGASDASGD